MPWYWKRRWENRRVNAHRSTREANRPAECAGRNGGQYGWNGGGGVRFLATNLGAVGQELIDLLAVLNAVRVALPTEDLRDF
jgi:hypothetical protein